jgi:Peptidase family M28
MRIFALMLVLVAVSSAQNTPQNSAEYPQKTAQSGSNVFGIISHKAVDFLLQPVPQPDTIRFAQLKQSFTDLECSGSHLREQTIPGGKNLVCTLPGNAPATIPPSQPKGKPLSNPSFGTILFVAHYEHLGPGQSAVDNWSGAVMLPCLYFALASASRNHTFLFAEVNGEAGARALFDSFTPQQRHEIKGIIALDAFGLGPAQYYISADDSFGNYGYGWLLHQLLQAAADQRISAPASAIPGAWFKTDVTREFRYHGIPSILLHSVSWSDREIPGSIRDNASAIDHKIYFNTLTLLSYYATELDKMWPSSTGNAASRPSGGRRR